VKQFEIWWAELPPPAGPRPILLLTRDSGYAYLNKFLAVEITTTERGIPVELELGLAEGLKRSSVANFDNVFPVSKHRLIRRMGVLSQRRWKEAKQALGFALEWDELTDTE